MAPACDPRRPRACGAAVALVGLLLLGARRGGSHAPNHMVRRYLVRSSRLSQLIPGVEVAQFDACIVGGELPVDLTLVGVGGVLPGGEFGIEGVEVADPAVEALPGQR